jgi:carbon storage regulator
MLVLSRKSAEAIEIGGGITVRVLDVRGGRVRLGIDAPQSVRIRRSEVPEEQTQSSPLRSAVASRSASVAPPLRSQVTSG